MDFQILIYYFLIMMENTEMNCQCTSWIGMGRALWHGHFHNFLSLLLIEIVVLNLIKLLQLS